MDEINFSRKPYTVAYTDFHTGELVKIVRRPPPLLHEMLPTDIVELTTKKGDDFQAGDDFTVKHISYRQPNTIQIQDDDGNTTFVPSFDLELKGKVAYRGVARIDDERANRYLLWP